MYNQIHAVETIRVVDQILKTPQRSVPFDKQKESPSSTNNYSTIHSAPKEQDIEELVLEAAEALEEVNTQLTFRIHEGTGRTHIQLIERESQQVIREIPPEKMLDILAGIWEWAGIIVDRKE